MAENEPQVSGRLERPLRRLGVEALDGLLHLFARRVGGGADALHAQLEVVRVAGVVERFLDRKSTRLNSSH